VNSFQRRGQYYDASKLPLPGTLKVQGRASVVLKGGKKMERREGKSAMANSTAFNRRKFLGLAGSVALIGLCVGFPNILRGEAPKEVLFGSICPMSGMFADDGLMRKRGLELAVEEINAAGGIKALGGAKIRVLWGDHQGKPEIGISEAEKMIRAGAVALSGTMVSGVGYATTQVAEKYKVPHIIDGDVADNITERGFKYTFRICDNSSLAVKSGLSYISDLVKETGVKLKTVVHLHEPTMFGTIVSQNLRKYAPAAGFEIIESIKYNVPATDLTSEIMRVKSLNPDILITSSWLQDGMLIVRTLKQLNVAPKMVAGIFNAAFSNPNFVPEIGKDAEFLMNICEFINAKNPTTQAVAKRFKEKFGKEFDFWAAYGYTAAYFFKDALERAKSADRERVKEAMKSSSMLAPLVQDGPIKIDENGQNANATVPMMQVQNGESLLIKPNSWAQAKGVLPFPKWEGRK